MLEKTPVYVSVGDVIIAELPQGLGTRQVGPAEVTAVVKRYGHTSGGWPVKPLVVVRLDNGEEKQFDLGWVTDVVSRYNGPRRRPHNVFAEFLEQEKARTGQPEMFPARIGTKKVCGPLQSLLRHYLAKLPWELDRPLDMERATMLFEKQRPGLVSREWEGYILVVREKPFMRWVRQHATQLMVSVKYLHQVEDRFHRAMEADYAEMVEREIAADMEQWADLDDEPRGEPDMMDWDYPE